jgi:outer membrane protein assembly factor BamE (lipoprotein component of BamABCDE complex)
MQRICLALIAALALTGCTTAMDITLPTGRSNAIFNATAIAQVQKGQTPADVRTIMGHAAERREVGTLTESWGYLTSYDNKMMTWITFTDDKVTSLSHEVLTRIQ